MASHRQSPRTPLPGQAAFRGATSTVRFAGNGWGSRTEGAAGMNSELLPRDSSVQEDGKGMVDSEGFVRNSSVGEDGAGAYADGRAVVYGDGQAGAYGGGRRAGAYGDGRGVYDRGAGGKIRSSRRATAVNNRKKTPYERPATGRHATPGGSSASPRPSIASRFVDSASRLISSSASYLFASLFKRRPVAIANGGSHTEGGILKEDGEEAENDGPKEFVDPTFEQNDNNGEDHSPAEKTSGMEITELDLAQVEGILTQQTWSREQVDRLTEILRSRVCENDAAGTSSEAQRGQENQKKLGDASSPVQVAKAYMDGQGSKPALASLIRTRVWATAHHPNRVSGFGLSPELGLLGGRPRVSVKSWIHEPVSGRKRDSVLDEDLWSVRRVRQKTMMLTSTGSPYTTQTAAMKAPQTLTSPPLQSKETARKIMETLEILTPSPKGKSVEREPHFAPGHLEQVPETSKSGETKRLQVEPPPGIKPVEPASSSGKSAPEAPVSIAPESSEGIPGSPTITPQRSKGFRMSALFEETNSDEESQAPILANDVGQTAVVSKGEAHVSAVDPLLESSSISVSRPSINTGTASDPAATHLPPSKPINVSAGLPTFTNKPSNLPLPETSMAASDSVVSFTSATTSATFPPVPALSPSSNFSFPAIVTESKASYVQAPALSIFSTFDAKGSPVSGTVTSAGPAQASTQAAASIAAAEVPEPTGSLFSSQPVSESAVASTIEATVDSAPALSAVLAPALGVALSVAPALVPALAPVPASEPVSATLLPGESTSTSTNLASAQRAATLSSEAPTVTVSSCTVPIPMVTPVTSGKSIESTPNRITVEGVYDHDRNGVTMATESPGGEKLGDLETMATDPMSEEPDASTVSPPRPAFQFGSVTAGVSTSMFSCGGGSTSNPSSMVSFLSGPASSSAVLPFTSQTGSATGQTFTFGATATPSPANPFSSAATFSFTSSSTGTSSSAFGTASSAPPSFPGTSSTQTTFSFGAAATSTTSSNATPSAPQFGFGSASPFGNTGSTSASFTFPSAPSNVSSSAPFSFGAGGNQSSSSGSSFSQPFTFGAQPQTNPFPSSGPTFSFSSGPTGSAASTFSFGLSGPPAATSPTFSFGGQSGSSFAGQTGPLPAGQPFTFGGQQPAAASPAGPAFGTPAFGNQPASGAAQPFGGETFNASSTGPPFSFGGQPSPPSQNPFQATGTSTSFSQPGFEFSGGFALGATGGEKPGRKYIKPKRTGSAKRGK